MKSQQNKTLPVHFTPHAHKRQKKNAEKEGK